MSASLSPNTQAILLLTAPLLLGRAGASPDPLPPGEYKRLVTCLRDLEREPADLLSPDAEALLRECQPVIDLDRAKRLLVRGFLLSQAVERWQTQAIWVVSQLDDDYPRRLLECLGENAPPVLYGCGDMATLDTGGLAVVGSRNVDTALLDYAASVGRLAAGARKTLISGGARGVDQAAMRGALETGGRAAGVLADSLERTAMNREHRNLLLDGRLVLVSPHDPSVGFNVGHAMQRNKLIYALADAALIVNSDFQQGGTWAGAVEQLDKLRFVPVFVRSTGDIGPGLSALRSKGARPWPNPEDPDAFSEVFSTEPLPIIQQSSLPTSVAEPLSPEPRPTPAPPTLDPARELFAKVQELLERMQTPKTHGEVAADLHVSKGQAKEWLQRLVETGVLKKCGRPVRYVASPAKQQALFGQQERT
jgi:predicted Rossmann fold nucleotide-binding protein DprA/Smf involved in DNA uptake